MNKASPSKFYKRAKIIVDPEFKKRAFSQNLEVYAPSSPDQFSTFIKTDSDLWLSVIKPLNIVEN